MVDSLISFMSLIVGLLILRSLGGDGVNIKFQLSPISSPEGRKQHFAIWVALSIMFTGLAYYFVRQRGADLVSLLIIPLLLGALITLQSRWRRKD